MFNLQCIPFQHMAGMTIAASNRAHGAQSSMIEKETGPAAAKESGLFQSTTGRATAAVLALVALVTAVMSLLKGFNEITVEVRQIVASFSREAPVVEPALPAAPPAAPPPSAPPAAAPVPRRDTLPLPSTQEAALPKPATERATGSLFVAAPPGSDGALIGTRARRVLEQEGFALAGDRNAARLAIEIAPPTFGPARMLPSSGLSITSVAATLEATISPSTGASPSFPPQQREAVGRGDGEGAARYDALGRAADQLAERIASALRQSAANSGASP